MQWSCRRIARYQSREERRKTASVRGNSKVPPKRDDPPIDRERMCAKSHSGENRLNCRWTFMCAIAQTSMGFANSLAPANRLRSSGGSMDIFYWLAGAFMLGGSAGILISALMIMAANQRDLAAMAEDAAARGGTKSANPNGHWT
jgi:hypothetical protein